MGMQCTFSRAEAENANCDVEAIYDKESDTHSCIIRDKAADAYITANYSLVHSQADEYQQQDIIWFDVGRASPEQLAKIGWLIRRRICFSCA